VTFGEIVETAESDVARIVAGWMIDHRRDGFREPIAAKKSGKRESGFPHSDVRSCRQRLPEHCASVIPVIRWQSTPVGRRIDRARSPEPEPACGQKVSNVSSRCARPDRRGYRCRRHGSVVPVHHRRAASNQAVVRKSLDPNRSLHRDTEQIE